MNTMDNKFCELVKLNDIKIDRNYQRICRKTVSKIVDNFDWRKFGVPTVSLRDDGSYYVIDGQHRVEAARQFYNLMGSSKDKLIWCDVLTNLTISDEATLFAMQGDNRTAVTSMEKLRAALLVDDKSNPYVYIHNTAAHYNLKCVSVDGHHIGISCIESFKRLIETLGTDVVDYICQVLTGSGWANVYDAHSKFWTAVFARCYSREVSCQKLMEFLFKRLPHTLLAESPRSGSKTSIADVTNYIIAECK